MIKLSHICTYQQCSYQHRYDLYTTSFNIWNIHFYIQAKKSDSSSVSHRAFRTTRSEKRQCAWSRNKWNSRRRRNTKDRCCMKHNRKKRLRLVHLKFIFRCLLLDTILFNALSWSCGINRSRKKSPKGVATFYTPFYAKHERLLGKMQYAWSRNKWNSRRRRNI